MNGLIKLGWIPRTQLPHKKSSVSHSIYQTYGWERENSLGNTNQTFKKSTDGHFSNVQCLLTNEENITHSLTILNNDLNLLCHTRNYVSARHLRQ